MRPVLFLVHGDMRMSRRFAVVIEALGEVPSYVLSTNNKIERLRATLLPKQPMGNLDQWAGKGRNEHFARQHHGWPPLPGDPAYAARARRLLPHLQSRVEELIEDQRPRWESLRRMAHACLRELEPAVVVVDIESVVFHRAVILAARDLGIYVLSMQHGEGYGFAYRRFPRLADGYIAYSGLNHETLLGMGVPEQAVFLTGNPDTDEVYRMDRAAVRRALTADAPLNPEVRRVLVSLKPNLPGKYSAQNALLLERLAAQTGPIQWLVKPHPVDEILDLPRTSATNLRLVPAGDPVTSWLAVADHLLGFYSSCVVEAALMDVPATMIHDPGVPWPKWHELGTFRYIQVDELDEALAGLMDAPRHIDPAARAAFIRRYRYRFDDGAAARVAGVIKDRLGRAEAGQP